MKGGSGDNYGFTMIEIIMVIVIISILAVALLPRASLIGGSVPTAADVIVSDIRVTQREAMSRETPLSVTFAAGNAAYKYVAEAAGNGEARNLTELAPNTSIIQGQAITFNSLGEPVGLAAPLAIVVTDGAITKTIMVEPYTGAVSTQ